MQWSTRVMGEKLWKSQVFLSGTNGSKKVARTWKMKTMLITFFDTKCNAHFEFVPQDQTLNQAYHYVEILKRLRESVLRKWPEFWLLPFSKNKVCLKETNNQKMWYHWKLLHYRSSKNVSNSGSILGLSAYLLKGSTSEVIPLSKLHIIQVYLQ